MAMFNSFLYVYQRVGGTTHQEPGWFIKIKYCRSTLLDGLWIKRISMVDIELDNGVNLNQHNWGGPPCAME